MKEIWRRLLAAGSEMYQMLVSKAPLPERSFEIMRH